MIDNIRIMPYDELKDQDYIISLIRDMTGFEFTARQLTTKMKDGYFPLGTRLSGPRGKLYFGKNATIKWCQAQLALTGCLKPEDIHPPTCEFSDELHDGEPTPKWS